MPYFGMSKLAIKWALSKPPTTAYPFKERRAVPGSRGQLVFAKGKCTYCTACAKKCPTGALVVERANKKLGIDRLRCITCGYCVDICPKDALALSTSHGVPTVTRGRESHKSD